MVARVQAPLEHCRTSQQWRPAMLLGPPRATARDNGFLASFSRGKRRARPRWCMISPAGTGLSCCLGNDPPLVFASRLLVRTNCGGEKGPLLRRLVRDVT